MKRIALSLALVFAVCGLSVAQATQAAQVGLASFRQEGKATWGMSGDGVMQAAHNSLPVGSKPTIRNIATGKETVVTVNGSIPVSTERIIDISSDAARAIGLQQGGAVLVYFPNAPAAQASVSGDGQMQGIEIVIHNHVIPASVLPAWLAAKQSGVPDTSVQQPPLDVNVIPALPDPNSGRVYRLLVGSWSSMDRAIVVFLALRDAGFVSVQEFSNSTYNVYASNVPASDAYSVIKRLGDMGFKEIRVEEMAAAR